MIPLLLSEAISAEGLVWNFVVPTELPFFEGHFPGHPILPGVVALGWLLAAMERFTGQRTGALEVLNAKFQVVILPGAALELTVVPKAGGRLQGTIRSEAGVHASVLIPSQNG